LGAAFFCDIQLALNVMSITLLGHPGIASL